MKKFLLVLIAAVSGFSTIGQVTTSPASVPANKLEGKTFKITLVAKERDMKASKMNENKDNLVTKTGSADGTISTTTTTSGSGSTVTSTTDTGVKDKNAEMAGSTTDEMKDGKSSEIQLATSPQPVTAEGTSVKSNEDYSVFTQPMANNKTTISFNNGMLESPMLTDRKLESCPYKVNSNESDMTVFTAILRSASPVSSAIWSGLVTGKSIKGSLTFKLGNGDEMGYTFTGVAVAAKKTGTKAKTTLSEAPVKIN